MPSVHVGIYVSFPLQAKEILDINSRKANHTIRSRKNQLITIKYVLRLHSDEVGLTIVEVLWEKFCIEVLLIRLLLLISILICQILIIIRMSSPIGI